MHDYNYYRGEYILNEVYAEMQDQHGGGVSFEQASSILSKVFNENTRNTMIRVLRGGVRTASGVGADVVTFGAGGDVATNSVFAIVSSVNFTKNMVELVATLREATELFNKLFILDLSNKIPIFSRLTLDDGLLSFEKVFLKILEGNLEKNGAKFLDKIHEGIKKILYKMTTVISDWIACLFPDTAGLAGEIAKTILDHVVNNGFTYSYNIISIIPDNLQKMITNPYALKDFIRKAIAFLKKVLNGLSPEQINEIISAIGSKAGDFSNNFLIKGAIDNITKQAIGSVNRYKKFLTLSSSIPGIRPQDIIIRIIERYVEPNIDFGVDLFYQLLPIFLMFVLFIEKYPLIKKQQLAAIKN